MDEVRRGQFSTITFSMLSTLSDQPRKTPFNQQDIGRSRQKRSAAISDEISMINRGDPRAVSGTNRKPYDPPVRGKTIDPEAAGHGTGGRMGENAALGREGPNAQGLGRMADDDEEDFQITRSERGPSGAVEEPAEGGASLMYGEDADLRPTSSEDDDDIEYQDEEDFDEEIDEDDDEEEEDDVDSYSAQHELALLEQFDKEDITAVPFRPDSVTSDEYLKLGQSGATIAAGNYEGVIDDRLKLAAEPTADGFRHPPYLAHKMMSGQIIRFKDRAEKDAVLGAAKKIAENRAARISAQRGGEDISPENFDFAPLTAQVQDSTLNKMVKGVYGDLNATPHKQGVLNEIQKMTMKNPTYLSEDGARFLNKVRTLLPSEAARKQQQKGRQGARR